MSEDGLYDKLFEKVDQKAFEKIFKKAESIIDNLGKLNNKKETLMREVTEAYMNGDRVTILKGIKQIYEMNAELSKNYALLVGSLDVDDLDFLHNVFQYIEPPTCVIDFDRSAKSYIS